MSSVLRPTFNEGQVLGAADLNAQVAYDRFAMVQHERTEHMWGVAQGLALQAVPQTTADGAKYADVNLLPGRAVDRLGRSIVVTEARPLDTEDFQLSSARPGDLFPVFVQAIEVPRTGGARAGACATAYASRIEESLQISFGAPGSELAVLDQDAAAVDAGFGTPALNDKVLVGWVSWDDALRKFTGVAASANGRGVRYVGVVASEVVAGGGQLALRTRPGGSRFALTVTENSTGGCELRFGKQDGSGALSPTFRVDDKGNVHYTGTLDPLPASKTLAESGVAFDGVRLPLPSGVSEEQVSGGVLRLHVVLTPVLEAPVKRALAQSTAFAVPVVVQCDVDIAGDRRVRCKVRWYDPTAPETNFRELPGACSYIVVASGK